MKLRSLLPLAFAAVAHGHTIFQKLSVDGIDQGQLRGVRAPTSDYPIENVNDPAMACNKDIHFKDDVVIDIPAGARVGAWWGHVIGGPQWPNDPDHPIAKSHKGPTIVYLAKVDNAATADPTGLKWFKIAEDGLTNSDNQWGVDRMINNDGWQYFTMPTCIAPGHYLMRVEIIALHSAYGQGGAQFYMECAQINVKGSGTNTGSDFVSFPGAYASNHPGVLLSIYSNTGVPNNGGKPYSIPGPPVLHCETVTEARRDPFPLVPKTLPPAAVARPTFAPRAISGSAVGVQLYSQCGGAGYSGATTCQQGSCQVVNEWYSQCLPA